MTGPNASGAALSGFQGVLASIVRTFVPWAVGVIITALAHINVVADSVQVEALVNGLVSIGIALAYYAIVRALEVFKSSKFGWLLGLAKAAPVYVAPAEKANEIQPGAADEDDTPGRHALVESDDDHELERGNGKYMGG